MNLDAVFRITAKVDGQGEISKLGSAVVGLEKSATAAKSGFKDMINSSTWQGAAVAAAAISAGIGLAVKSAISFESSMADVRKVVDGLESPAALAQMREEIMGLSEVIPIAASGFADIYAAAGEAGIAKEEIKAFAVDVAQMAVAFGMTAEEAGTSLAKIRTALGLTQPELRLLGDAMNHLSNNLAATAPQLVDFTKRTGSMGVQAGFTATQTTAIGAAMIAAGAETEVAATSFNNMVRALTRGESMTTRQGDALFKLGLASKSAADEEKRLSAAVEQESERRMEQARRETDNALKEINRRYRDQLTVIRDGWEDQADAYSDSLQDQSRAQTDALRARESAEIESLRRSAEATKADTSAAEAAIRARYAGQIDVIEDATSEQLKLARRAARDQQQVVMDQLDDRKELEVKAVQDRYKEIEKIEKERMEEAKIRAKVAAEAISKEAGAELAKRMQEDAVGTMRDVFTRINNLPKEMRISVISDLFGDEARALAPLINNMGLLEKSLALVGNQSDYAGSSAKEFAVRVATTGSQIQLAQNKVENLMIKLAEEGGLVDAVMAGAQALGEVVKAITAVTNLVPGLTPLLVGLAAAFAAIVIAAPGIAALVPVIQSIALALGAGGLGTTLAGLGTVAAVAVSGMISALGGFLAWIGTVMIPGILAFLGPVGWTVLAVAAVVAMAIAFREPIMQFFAWMGTAIEFGLRSLWQWGEPIRAFWFGVWEGIREPVTAFFEFVRGVVQFGMQAAFAIAFQVFVQPWINLWENVLRGPVTAAWEWMQGIWVEIGEAWETYVTEPITDAWKTVTDFVPKAMKKVSDTVAGIWTGMVNGIKSVIRGMLQYVANAVNSISKMINVVIAAFNKLPGPDIGLIPQLQVPAFAAGGVVARPTLALVGEGGEREYIIPESKMARASENYLSGQRGEAVLAAQRFQMPTVTGSGGVTVSPGSSPINITTGPVMQMDGTRYVTLQDMERGMRQVENRIYSTLRTPGGRRAIGVGR